jgi:hypothetical protein
MPASVAASFGARFGHDFSSVRVHADAQAAASARVWGARAFTIGWDIHFGADQYQPDTSVGQRLIAHELAHVVQQRGRRPTGMTPDRSGEHAAHLAADRALGGRSVRLPQRVVTGPQLEDGKPPVAPPRQAALTPEDLWKMAQNLRGFESTSGGKGDDYRSKPATLPERAFDVDDKGRPPTGAPLGKGYETVAAVQVLDADGNQVDVGTGIFRGGGPDQHAEAVAVRGLESHTPSRIEGGKLVVVGDQTICPTCRARLLAYAESRGLTVIEPHEPSRAKVYGTGTVSPKTASRSSTQAGKPTLSVVQRASIPVGHSGGGGAGGTTPTSPNAVPPASAVAKTSPVTPAKPTLAAPDVSPSRSGTPPSTETLKKGTVTVKVESGGKPRVTLQEIDASRLSADKGTHLSKSPSGAALVHAFSAAQLGRQLLDLGAMASDEHTAGKIGWFTHPVQSYFASKVTDAQTDFLAAHPDPSSLASRLDADQLRGVYEKAWMRLSAPEGARVMVAIAVAMTPADQRGPEWYQAAEYVRKGTAGVNAADLAAFQSATTQYQSRMIDTLQEVAQYRSNLPQLAAEIEQRADVLGQIANDFEETWWSVIRQMPLAFYVMPDLLGQAGFIRQLSSRLSEFARVVRARHRAYERLDDEYSAQLQQVERHIDDPGAAVREAMGRRRRRP